MRPLILAAALLGATQVQAESPTAKLSSNLTTESGSADLATTGPATSMSKTFSVDASTGTVAHVLVVRLGADRIQPDYSRILIEDAQGKTHSLSDDFSQPETRVRVGSDLYVERFSFLVDGASTGGSSTPFPGSSVKLKNNYDDYDNGSRYSLGFSRSDYSAGPISYFQNPDTQAKSIRPTRNQVDRVSLAIEQVLAERWKAKAELFSGDKPASRPPFSGGELSLAFAVTDESALLAKTGLAHEDRSAQLFDDRGYFDALWSQLEYRIEPNYRWSVSALIGTVLETETARGSLSAQQIGTDTAGLVLQTRGHAWELGLRALSSLSNSGYQATIVAGDLTWQI